MVLALAAMGALAPGQASAEESGCVITLSSVCGDPAPGPQPGPGPSTTTTTTAAPAQPSPAEAAAQLLARANEARAAAGVAPLSARADVAEIAQGWSGTMSRNGALSHNDEYFSAATKERLDAGLRGENVAFAGDIDQAHRALMNSAPHRANILDARFSVVGMGAVFADGTWWVTQDFLQPRTASASAPAAAPNGAAGAGAEERPRALPAVESTEPAPAAPRSVAVLAATPAVPHDLEGAASTSAPIGLGADRVESESVSPMVPLAMVALALAAAVGVAMLVLS